PVQAVPGHPLAEAAEVDLLPAPALERGYPAGAEEHAADAREPAHGRPIQLDRVTFMEAAPAVDEANHLEAVHVDSTQHCPADSGVHSRAVSARTEHTNTHSISLAMARC